MANNWHELKPSQMVPPGITDVTSAFSEITSAVTTALEVSKTVLELSQTFAESASTDVIETTLQTLLSELQGFVEGFSTQTTAHSIFIPIQKQPFGLGVEPPEEIVPREDRPPSYDTFAENNGIDEDDEHPQHLVNFINSSLTAVGGNRGVWKKLYTSLKDEGDEARPEFPDNFAVTGVAIIFGATNLREMMKKAHLFQRILKRNPRADLTANVEPVPKGLKSRIVPDPLSSQIGVILEWELLEPTQNPSLFSNEQLIADELFIIRSKNPEMREKLSWSEIFTSEPKDSGDLLEEGDYQVVKRIPNDGFVRKYVDTVELDVGTTYYYALAARYTLDGERQPMGQLSNVTRVNYTGRPVDSRRSEAPDWLATPSLIELFPPIQGLLNKVQLAIAGLTARTVSTGGVAGALTQSVEQLEREIERIEQLNTELTTLNGQLRQFLSVDPGGLYTTVITASNGGIERWMAELARCLSDTEDSTRPPFDEAELVGGVFILAGAPNLPQLSAFQELLNLFFGSAASNPLLDAIDSVESAVATVEERTFDEALNEVAASSVAEEDLPSGTLFNDSMTPTNTPRC